MYLSFILKNHDLIASLDPLELDSELKSLPNLNFAKDIKSLNDLLDKAILTASSLDLENLSIAHACLRDIGFLISALRKTGVQPALENNSLEKLLLKLGAVTGTVPRETSYHYGICNPTNHRQRVFTSFPDELGLINGVRVFSKGLEEILVDLLQLKFNLSHKIPSSFDFLNRILIKLGETLKEAGDEMKRINPRIFSYELRPYFDPILIDGIAYVGPGGGQVPLLVIDNILFAFELDDSHIYKVFSNEGVKYLTPELQAVYEKHTNLPSIVSLAKSVKSHGVTDFLINFLNELIRYRQVHYKVAMNALSDKNKGNYETGSAGYRLEMVHQTLLATKEAKRILIE